MRHKYRVGLLLMLMCASLLFGCQNTLPGADTEPTLPSYTVQFMVGGEIYATQKISEGGTPTEVVPEIRGAVIGQWQDEMGNVVQPHTLSVEKDTVYKAKVYPDLSVHAAYLFGDKAGFLRPDDMLTGAEMNTAFASIAAPGAEKFLPRLPGGQDAVTVQSLKDVLVQMFPEDAVEQVMPQVSGETVTRGAFAIVVNALTHRDQQTGVLLTDEAKMPFDLSGGHKACAALLEASLEHSHGQEGASWETAIEKLRYAPGFMNVDGWLYYVNEDGTVARDTQVGELTFGADGRFTSSDAALDTTVAGILAQIVANNPDAPRIDLLRRAFEYSRDSFKYLRRSAYEFGATGWEIEDAKKMFDTAKGNCYNFAASFWALARGLGYEAKCISGTMTKTDQPHSWVEIVMEDGKPYIFDPQMEYAYVHERDIFDKDMFMVTYIAGAWWNYKRP